MNILKKLISISLCALLLCSCAHEAADTVVSTPPPSVTIGTMPSVTAAPETTVTSETINTGSVTAPTTSSQPPERTDSPETAVSSSDTSPIQSVSAPVSEDELYEIEQSSAIMYASSSVNVREKPDADSKRVGHLDEGDEVRVTGLVSNGWARIVFKDGEYFVNAKYLTTESDPVETTQPTEITTTPPVETVPPASETEATTTTPPVTTAEPTTTAETTTDPIFESPGFLTNPSSYTALNYPVQKAVWLAYIDIDEMLAGASESDFTAKVSEAMDNVIGLGCNTVYVHVRAFGDAYYYSSLFPFAASYSGTLGEMPPYDPLAIMIDEAHRRGISFHAWINPMRTTTRERYREMSSAYTLKQWYDSDSTNGTFIVYDRDTEFYWLSPAYPAVRSLICSGVAEIVTRYNVDAIHIDDYFYPTTSSSFDKAAFEASGASDRAEWRKSVVNSLVSEIYSTVKVSNPTVLFGVSPQGNIDNNLNRLYADVTTWCSTPGYLDYIVPQVYYGFNDKLSFDAAAKQWEELVTLPSVSLVCGIAAYKVGVNREWSSGEILSKQTDYISDSDVFDGVAYYRLYSLFGSASSSERLMKQELPALARSIGSF